MTFQQLSKEIDDDIERFEKELDLEDNQKVFLNRSDFDVQQASEKLSDTQKLFPEMAQTSIELKKLFNI